MDRILNSHPASLALLSFLATAFTAAVTMNVVIAVAVGASFSPLIRRASERRKANQA